MKTKPAVNIMRIPPAVAKIQAYYAAAAAAADAAATYSAAYAAYAADAYADRNKHVSVMAAKLLELMASVPAN